MNFLELFLSILIYVVIFFLIEKVSFKEQDSFLSRVIYAVGFSALIIGFNIFLIFREEPPHIANTIFQIGIVLSISIGYLVWQYNKKNSNK